MVQLLSLRGQLMVMLAISAVLIPFLGKSMLIPAALVALCLQGVQLEIERD